MTFHKTIKLIGELRRGYYGVPGAGKGKGDILRQVREIVVFPLALLTMEAPFLNRHQSESIDGDSGKISER